MYIVIIYIYILKQDPDLAPLVARQTMAKALQMFLENEKSGSSPKPRIPWMANPINSNFSMPNLHKFVLERVLEIYQNQGWHLDLQSWPQWMGCNQDTSRRLYRLLEHCWAVVGSSHAISWVFRWPPTFPPKTQKEQTPLYVNHSVDVLMSEKINSKLCLKHTKVSMTHRAHHRRKASLWLPTGVWIDKLAQLKLHFILLWCHSCFITDRRGLESWEDQACRIDSLKG